MVVFTFVNFLILFNVDKHNDVIKDLVTNHKNPELSHHEAEHQKDTEGRKRTQRDAKDRTPKDGRRDKPFQSTRLQITSFIPKGSARFLEGPGFQRLRLFVNASQHVEVTEYLALFSDELLAVDGCALEVTEDLALFRDELLPADGCATIDFVIYHIRNKKGVRAARNGKAWEALTRDGIRSPVGWPTGRIHLQMKFFGFPTPNLENYKACNN